MGQFYLWNGAEWEPIQVRGLLPQEVDSLLEQYRTPQEPTADDRIDTNDIENTPTPMSLW